MSYIHALRCFQACANVSHLFKLTAHHSGLAYRTSALKSDTSAEWPQPSSTNLRAPIGGAVAQYFPIRALSLQNTSHQRTVAFSQTRGVKTNAKVLTADRYTLRKGEMRNLVDMYDYQPKPEDVLVPESPVRSLGTTITQPEVIFELLDEDHVEKLTRLENRLADWDTPHDELYDIFESLPEPYAAHLPQGILSKLLDYLSAVEHKTEAGMLRYLAVIESARQANRDVAVKHWNTAIHLAGRCFAKVSDTQVDRAMAIWHEFEDEGKGRARATTFNILFDITSKAGKFTLTDAIREEMVQRGLQLDRYFRTGLIIHYGQRRDGDKVRQAYMDLIHADEIVDTAVINCVIKALLACGETSSAEQTFERQKQLHTAKKNGPLAPSNWRVKRQVGKWLKREGRRIRDEKSAEERLGEVPEPNSESSQGPTKHSQAKADTFLTTSVAPNFETYNILIQYHAIQGGDIERCATLIEEMGEYDIVLRGVVFLHLFIAFQKYGGIVYTQWTIRRLENTWLSYLTAVDADNGARMVFISKTAALCIAAAFYKCTNSGRVAEVWFELRARLQGEEDMDIERLEARVGTMMGDDSPLFWEVMERRLQEQEQEQEQERSASGVPPT